VLRGVGPAIGARLATLNIYSVQDLLLHLPSRYQDRTRIVPLGQAVPGRECLVAGEVLDSKITYGRRRSWLVTLTDGSGFLTLRFFHFSKRQQAGLNAGMHVRCFGQIRMGPNGLELVHPEYRAFTAQPDPPEPTLTPIYPTTEGLGQARITNLMDQALGCLADWPSPDLTDLSDLLDDTAFPNLADALRYLHRPPVEASASRLAAARERAALDELLASILVMKRRQRARATERARALPRSQQLGRQLRDRLEFELTAAQRRVITEVLLDLEKPQPMLRLIQGDVGSGKTVVAAFAAVRAAEHDCQTAVMAPTELLAEQHYLNFSDWLAPLGITVALHTGGASQRDRRERSNRLAAGDTLVAVGTHALFQRTERFANLALTVIDEQHRFGVHQRMLLKDKGRSPHQLIMTATPIPRTLTMALYADMDVSIIDELPPGRMPVTTTVVSDARRDEVIARVARACAQGQQAYWVCTLIEASEALDYRDAETTHAELRERLAPQRVTLLHGQMPGAEKTRVMAEFKAGAIDVLVATTVIEVGVDVPNASLMVIENPERLGLAQLHQLRGRVGRGRIASHCVLLYRAPLSESARARLNVMRASNDGFVIAEKDLQLRGPGEILGTRQTGEVRYRVLDLTAHAHLIGKAAQMAGVLVHDSPRSDALIATWSPAEGDYSNV
jgi:ATP-dependent DNA helicase RecG